MSQDPRLTPLAATLPASVPFVGPETQERARGALFQARLGANENGFGPSPSVIAAMQSAAQDVWKYGDPENHDLVSALSAHLQIPAENIAIGEGIDGLLGLLVRLYASAGDAVVTSHGAYPTFNYHVAGYGAELHTVSYKDDHEDPVALIAKAREVGAKLVYIANPDNPMGSCHAAKVIERMIEDLPQGCLLLLDEAYVEFAPDSSVPNVDPDDPRVVRLRTFSKAYGMAGARVGYAISARNVITGFNKVRNHFGVGKLSQAGATAAVGDQAWLRETVDKVDAARNEIARIAADNGLSALRSATNFVAIDCGADGAFAKAVLEALIKRGIFVRMPFVPPLDRCIRVSCGQNEELAAFARALPQALEEARAKEK